MSKPVTTARLDLVLESDDAQRLANLCGPFDAHLRQIELRLGIEIRNRGNRFQLVGGRNDIRRGEAVLQELFNFAADDTVTTENVHMALAEQLGAADETADDDEPASRDDVVIRGKRGVIRGRGVQQKQYLKNIATHDLNFGIGPAGTGKTYLAVASAVHALERDRVRRIVLVRPAVEAGEKLGFLPGDMAEKINPYLRPLYDALYEMLGFERVARLTEKNVIEVAPLAFMRGRTLNESFVILDEAQNTTIEQMKMFLTRIGFGSVAVVTGDMTQTDLPKHMTSGLKQALTVLDGVPGISFTHFRKEDVVRHPLVQAIVHAYEQHERAAPREGGEA
ncbi:PhoH family protein [Solimonas variicoloris]|uniref:PhoH family protein n=1 Tax=Solimonas variicoloris TaxID=254408 RepID=UPI00037A4449|nr:PhoH family protein [Solimonas variicoloris]